ncbi:MAG: response regulator transcription factor [Calditrichia bacterium]
MNKSQPNTILIVEDEESLGKVLQFNLQAEGYHVVWVTDGKKAIETYREQTFDLIILDIMLPYMDGFEVARQIRKTDPQVPILMLTARSQVQDRITGLETGADDYITKPFHLNELLLRIQRMLVRKSWYKSSATKQSELTIGKITIDFKNLKLFKDEQEKELTLHEAMVLRYLIENRDKIVSRKELLKEVWNLDEEVETRTVDNFIVRLRKFIEPDPKNPKYIISVRGVGYKFEPDTE